MTTSELMYQLARHSFVTANLAMSVQLGLPYLEKLGNRLCVRFRPHKQALQGDKIAFYQPQYELVFAYPFDRVVRFENLVVTQNSLTTEPICLTDKQFYVTSGKYAITELYEAYDRALSFQEEYGRVSDITICKCQEAFWDTVEELNLKAVYTEG